MKQKVIAIVGPTAVGKTKLSIEIAKQFNGEIISGDSMQIYRGMDIGTAKITEGEKLGIPHYMLDIKDPSDNFSVADFQHHVTDHIETISSKGHLPIIAGGSGLYIQSALYNYNFSNDARDNELTLELEQDLDKFGAAYLHERLQKIDPHQAVKIHPNNHRRLIRAIEIYETTGKTMSAFQAEQKESPYDPIFIGLEMEREMLYNRINTRIDQMVQNGLLYEVHQLYVRGLEDCQSMRGIGYKEFIPYFKGEYDLDYAIELLKRNSRRFAKRQYTWFKNKMDVAWYSVTPDTIGEKFRTILRDLAGMLG
ncbi:tRNA (adenosine(37)-N6)-dimethylallyltransferase MiaA [Virgibacillus phasianinus]|uniref:tRNA dimethylallyltransferase n=1 Tax=Virgibacillus phasianinus TaxID=2017483 RepID=A0A220U6I4_9BACI|nr:tRNA (adenosine(37)-N6)-dimethylallyltransferase MiaA [Virgibacillus phasianinus]ASK63451.1 tRNA (adenosine(37)-N6)-dimethylallyltransferase MiaA [Virgibacillus phasianinus]